MLIFNWASASAQQADLADTIIYKVVEEMPRFPGCEALDTSLQVKSQCAQQRLLAFIYQNIVYPIEARREGNEGTVVVSFVVEKDGFISNPRIVRDIGGGCGEEALRIISAMNQSGVRWTPGKKDGKPVRVQFNLPVKFKLKEALPYIIVEGDSIWTDFDEPLEFEGGIEGLIGHIEEKLDYPVTGNDSCLIGNIDVQLLVRNTGEVRILNLTDYNDLGFDFWYEAIDAATSTFGKWKIATYEGRKVPTAYDLSLSFAPSIDECKQKVDDYEVAAKLVEEGMEMFNSEKKEEGIQKMTEGINMFPDDANFLLARGQAYLDTNRMEEACADLSKAREIALVSWYDNILSLICK